jgi:hypothetical protein
MSSSPDTPDVVGAATAEGQASRTVTTDQTYANRPDQYNTFGSNTWQQENVIDPATGESVVKWTNREQLSPEMQELYNQDVNMNLGLGATAGSMNNRINEAYATPMDWASYGDPLAGPQAGGPVGGNVDPTTAANQKFGGATDQLIGGGLQATSSGGGYSGASSELTGGDMQGTTGGGEFAWDSANRGRAEDASYGRSTSRLDPQWQQKRAEFERTMVGRGLRAGDSAFDSGMQNFDRSSNDAYEQARLGSVGEGRLEDQQSYGQAKGAWDSNRAAEQQRFDQAARAATNAREARSQKYGEGYNDWQSGQTAQQQQFDQNKQVGENERDAYDQRYDQQLGQFGTNQGVEQQAFDQQIKTGENNRNAYNDSFDQGVTATDMGNALRTQNISEDLAIRNMPLEERNRLMAARGESVGQMGSNYSSGG